MMTAVDGVFSVLGGYDVLCLVLEKLFSGEAAAVVQSPGREHWQRFSTRQAKLELTSLPPLCRRFLSDLNDTSMHRNRLHGHLSCNSGLVRGLHQLMNPLICCWNFLHYLVDLDTALLNVFAIPLGLLLGLLLIQSRAKTISTNLETIQSRASCSKIIPNTDHYNSLITLRTKVAGQPFS